MHVRTKISTFTLNKGEVGGGGGEGNRPPLVIKIKKKIKQNGGFYFKEIFVLNLFFTFWLGSLNLQNYELAPQPPSS